ncbi:protein of unknown function [Methylococcus capsulatus]|uniref:Uncharacterized protein n=1 Tax=Methylococcus capsulatus TaxID=414 RepID=A0AA35XZB4_METCP|nr:protein of unknown function [Methylococcus capsulatus]
MFMAGAERRFLLRGASSGRAARGREILMNGRKHCGERAGSAEIGNPPWGLAKKRGRPSRMTDRGRSASARRSRSSGDSVLSAGGRDRS